MGRTTKVSDAFAAAYPNIARWVNEEEGWLEVGSDEHSTSFVRVLYGGGMAWEGADDYPTIDAAFADADAGIAEWLDENRPPALKKLTRAAAKKKPAGMKLVRVDSSMVSAIGYDEATKELEAVFHSGAVWRYRDVPKMI